MNKHRLEQIEKYVISFFQARQQTRILAKELFESTSAYANADIVRALEALEKKERLLVRHTTEGNDYISLTPQGVEHLGLWQAPVEDELPAMPHPPKSATKVV
jgi:DNA-binding PadR family transcriptional regulator